MQDTNNETNSSAGKWLILLVIVAVAVMVGFIIYLNVKPKTTTTTLSQSYCNTQGGVCFSYPKGWSASSTSSGVSITDPSHDVDIVYTASTPASSTMCAANDCQFTGLSTIISSGFSNGNDAAGILHNKQTGTYSPEYFLIATPQLLRYGLAVGSTVSLSSPFMPTFTNTNAPSAAQTLKVVFTLPISFTSSTASQNWLSSNANAKTAEAIINSARKD